MIRSIDDVIGYCKRAAREQPSLADRYAFVSPGLDRRAVEELAQRLPTLPESFLNFVSEFQVSGVELGGLGLSPSSSRRLGLVEALSTENAADVLLPSVRGRGLWMVGGLEVDMICIEDTESLAPGRIWRVDLGFGPDPRFSPMTNGIDQLVVAAAQIDATRQAGAVDLQDSLSELEEALWGWSLGEAEIANWREIFSMHLDWWPDNGVSPRP